MGAAVISLVFVILVLSLVLPKNKVKIEDYERYSLTVHISGTKRDKSKEAKIITVNSDNERANITFVPDCLEYDIYLVEDTLYYEKENRAYKVQVQNRYTLLYDCLKDAQKYDKLNKTNQEGRFYLALNQRSLNRILDNLYFVKKADKPAEAKMSMSGNKIKSFHIKIEDIGDFEEIELNFSFTDLKDDTLINVPKKIIDYSVETEENPFYMIK